MPASTPQPDHFQQPPHIASPWAADKALRQIVRRLLPADVYDKVEGDLANFGERVAGDVLSMHWDAGRNEPALQRFDANGRRVDVIHTSAGWRALKTVSAEEGLVGIAYERDFGSFSRVYWAAKMLMFGPSSGLFNCPLAMTDGAARLIECSDDAYLKAHALPHLTSRAPGDFWTSGQWMTEKAGGSDVARSTETTAEPLAGEEAHEHMTHRLYGVKWFTSATDSNMALALARERGSDGELIPGNQGLAIFYLELRDAEGALNNIEVLRLKEKMGTRQLPTAELHLCGALARKVSDSGRGIHMVSSMLNVTRVYNAVAAVGHQRRMVQLARDFAGRRTVFGKRLAEQPLHARTLAAMEVEGRGNLQLVMDMARLLGKSELGESSEEDEAVLRLLTPVCKLYTAKQGVSIASEGLEAFGGHGYVEDSGIPETLRDCQVLTIWEGATNIMALDVLRVLQKQPTSLLHWQAAAQRLVAEPGAGAACASAVLGAGAGAGHAVDPRLARGCAQVAEAAATLGSFWAAARGLAARARSAQAVEGHARDFALSLARVHCAALLCAQARASAADAVGAGSEGAGERDAEEDLVVALRWIEGGLLSVPPAQEIEGADPAASRAAVSWDQRLSAPYQGTAKERPYGPSFAARL